MTEPVNDESLLLDKEMQNEMHSSMSLLALKL